MNRLFLFLSVCLTTMLVACSDDKEDGNGGSAVADPVGTIIINLAEDNYYQFQYSDENLSYVFHRDGEELARENISSYCLAVTDLIWKKPDNLAFSSNTGVSEWLGGPQSLYDIIHENGSEEWYPFYLYLDARMVNVGPVNSLGNIKQAPSEGWEFQAVACEPGHGYIIKISIVCYYSFIDIISEPLYIRLYVEEPIVSTTGGIMGAKIKLQYPFYPSNI